MKMPPLTAALAGVPTGVQALGPWAGRRQLFVRFAGEAETATMYTAAALASELKRQCERSVYHSIAIGGRDALGNGDFLAAALKDGAPAPVLLDVDGQRPEALGTLAGRFALVQVVHELPSAPAATERVLETLRRAAALGAAHALVLATTEETSDTQLLRTIEGAHGASGGTIIVVHPPSAADATQLDRRWSTLLEQAARVHGDVRLMMRVPPPVGMR